MDKNKENNFQDAEADYNHFVETEKKVVRDRPIKSIVKALTWRIIAYGTTAIILYSKGDPWEEALKIGLADSGIKLVLYYFHERAWAQLRWGRMLVRIRRNSPMPRVAFNKIFRVKKKQ